MYPKYEYAVGSLKIHMFGVLPGIVHQLGSVDEARNPGS
jgi:hypothetical protein